MLVHIYGAFHDAPSVRLAGGQMKGWKEGQVGHNSCRSEAGRWTTLAFSILIFVFISKYCLALSCPGRPNTQTMAESTQEFLTVCRAFVVVAHRKTSR